MELRSRLLSTVKRAYKDGLFAGTSGNLSIYNDEDDTMLITPTSIAYEVMKEKDLVLMKLNGDVIIGEHKPSSEWKMHASIYANKKDVKSIVHTHSPYATSFGVIQEEIPVILIEMVPFLGGNVRVADFALPGSCELGDNCVKALQDRGACIMANHGVVSIGSDIDEAYLRAVYVEDAAKICTIANINGKKIIIDDDMINKMR